jgi:polar amino acid transport system substrate-binding protein
MKRKLLLVLCIILLNTGLLINVAQGVPSGVAEKKLVVAITQDPPYTYKNEQGKWQGLNVELWKLIAGDLKIDYTLKEMTFEESLDALKKGTVDLSICAMFITSEREQLYEMTTPFGSTRLAVATLHDGNDHPWFAAIKIFFSWSTLKILLVLVVILFIMGFLFWMIERKSNPEHFGQGTIKGISSGIYWVGSTLASGVCFGISLKSLAGRILGLMWMLVCALALSALIASLSSSLTLSHQEEKKLSSDKMRNMHLGTETGGITAAMATRLGGRTTLYKDEDATLHALLEKKIEGFLYDEITLHYYAEKPYRGKITVLMTDLKSLSIGFGMPRNSVLRKPINIAMLSVIEGPLWESILNRYGLDRNFAAKSILLGRDKKRGRPSE